MRHASPLFRAVAVDYGYWPEDFQVQEALDTLESRLRMEKTQARKQKMLEALSAAISDRLDRVILGTETEEELTGYRHFYGD